MLVPAPSFTRRARAFVKLGRPRFLAGGILLYLAGAVLAWRAGERIDLVRLVLGQCAVTATQLMTHYSNDYFDLEADRDNHAATRWSGGSRVLVEGALEPRVARDAALVFGGLALAIDLVITYALQASWQTSAILGAMLVLSWGYSAPPLRLHHRGFGPVTAAVVVGGLTPMSGAVMQRGELTSDVLAAVTPLALAQLAVVLVLDLPDATSDGAAGKRTLAVRFGTAKIARVAGLLVILTYLVVACRFTDAPKIGLAMTLTLPAGLAVLAELLRGRWRVDASRLTGRSIFWFGALSMSLLIGAWLDARG